jgi:AAA domain
VPKQDLQHLEVAQPQQVTPDPLADLDVTSARQLAQLDFSEPDPIVPGFIYRGCVTGIAAFSGIGKTETVFRMFQAGEMGREFLGRPVGRHRMLYLAEESPYVVKPRLERQGMLGSDDLLLMFLDDIAQHRRYGWAAIFGRIIELASAKDVDVIVIDRLNKWSGLTGEGAENDAGPINAMFDPLGAARSLGLAVVAFGSTAKASSSGALADDELDAEHVRGSGDWSGNCDIAIVGKKPRDRALRNDVRFWKVGRSRFDPGWDSMYVKLLQDGSLQALDGDITAAVSQLHELEAVRDAVARFEPSAECPRATREWIAQALEIGNKREAQQRVRGAVNAGLIVLGGGLGVRGNPQWFCLPEDLPETEY